MDKDGVHTHVEGACLVLHLQVVLPQGHGRSECCWTEQGGQVRVLHPLVGRVEREVGALVMQLRDHCGTHLREGMVHPIDPS